MRRHMFTPNGLDQEPREEIPHLRWREPPSVMMRSLLKATLGHKHTLKQQSESSVVLPLS